MAVLHTEFMKIDNGTTVNYNDEKKLTTERNIVKTI